MKAIELRIGNLVALTDEARKDLFDCYEIVTTDNIFEVCGINKHKITLYIYGEEEEFRFEDIKPIQITEERLLKFGAKKILGYGHSINGLHGFIINCVWYRYYDLYIECKYIHQLQTMHLELTGKELTIK